MWEESEGKGKEGLQEELNTTKDLLISQTGTHYKI